MPEASVVAREDTKLWSRTKCLACVSHRSVHAHLQRHGGLRRLGAAAPRRASRETRRRTRRPPPAWSTPSPRRGAETLPRETCYQARAPRSVSCRRRRRRRATARPWWRSRAQKSVPAVGPERAEKPLENRRLAREAPFQRLLLGAVEGAARVLDAAGGHAQHGSLREEHGDRLQQLGRAARLEHDFAFVHEERRLAQHVRVEGRRGARRDNQALRRGHRRVQGGAGKRAQTWMRGSCGKARAVRREQAVSDAAAAAVGDAGGRARSEEAFFASFSRLSRRAGYLGFFEPTAERRSKRRIRIFQRVASMRAKRASGKAGRRTLFAAPIVEIDLHPLLHALEVGARQDARVLRGLDGRQRVRARRGGHRERGDDRWSK